MKFTTMKKLANNIILTLIMLALLPACETDENDIKLDNSLIIVHSKGNRYAIVSPATGKVIDEVEPGIQHHISTVALGYNSNKALLLSKEPGGTYVKVIYSCDRETGDNVFQVTSEDMWDIQTMSASPAGPQIVFHGHPVDGGASTSNLFKINIDGTGVEQLTQNREVVDGIELWWPKSPSWSPDGRKIAFRGTMRTPDPGAYWWGESVILMDANGRNKQILYNEPDANSGNHKDISWSKDGRFLVFLTNEYYSNPVNRVKVLAVEDGSIMDITDDLLVEGKHTTNLCTSPMENKIAFNKYQPGGGDLHVIDFIVTSNGEFQISGPFKILSKVESGGLQFGSPDWQLWPQE